MGILPSSLTAVVYKLIHHCWILQRISLCHNPIRRKRQQDMFPWFFFLPLFTQHSHHYSQHLLTRQLFLFHNFLPSVALSFSLSPLRIDSFWTHNYNIRKRLSSRVPALFQSWNSPRCTFWPWLLGTVFLIFLFCLESVWYFCFTLSSKLSSMNAISTNENVKHRQKLATYPSDSPSAKWQQTTRL